METLSIKVPDEIKGILTKYYEALQKRKDFELGFNIFSILSDTYYKENFHSEIISALLNPEQNQSYSHIFLDLLLDFLNDGFSCNIDKTKYKSSIVVRNEASTDGGRRIDILIYSNSNAIIIENKLHNALDMNNQLVDYYSFCIQKNLEVDAIIYLSLDGKKSPDKNTWNFGDTNFDRVELENKLLLMPAYAFNESASLYSWLTKCYEYKTNVDTQTIINQYRQLLKSLRGYIMETKALKVYYEFITQPENRSELENFKAWQKMHNDLNKYFPEKLKAEIDLLNIEKHWYQDSIIWADTSVLFRNINSDNNYYLKVDFTNTEQISILLMDNTKKWLHDEVLNKCIDFKDRFKDQGNYWVYNTPKIDLLTNFNKLVEAVKDILNLLSEIIVIR